MARYEIEATNGKTCRHLALDEASAAQLHATNHIRVKGSVTFERQIGRNHFYRFTRSGFPLAKTFAVRVAVNP